MPIAREGIREILIGTVVLGLLAWGGAYLFWPLALIPVIVWIWLLSFFRDPPRRRGYAPGEFCAPADGTVTEVNELEFDERIGGPAIRVGIFLSLFNVHVNRSPCSGKVIAKDYKPGEFLDARRTDSGERNEASTLVLEPEAPLVGPVVVRQVAGKVARRIICHVGVGDSMPIGYRFGMIKFGSRTELIVPRIEGTQVCIQPGDVVKGGLTILLRQPAGESARAESPAPAADSGMTPQR